MPRCAACRSEISGRDQFKLIEEFAVHARCLHIPVLIRSELAEQTALVTKLQKAVRDQAALRESAENAERTARIAHDHVARELAMARADLAAERSRRTSLEFQLELARGRSAPDPTPAMEPEGSPPAERKEDLELRVKLLELT